MDKPFAITLDPGSSLANHTGSWRTTRPVYVDRLPPCNHACPAGENIQAWLFHAESGDYEAAWRELVKNNPLPAIMGRVCYHPCETACNRGSLDESVSIHAVERFLGDEATRRGWQVEAGAPSGKRVLVVGAGPAGLSAAWHLRLAGHAVTIHEAGPLSGGMMRFGIPKYRLPREVLDADVQRILDLGVELKLNSKVDDLQATMQEGGFDACFLGVGALFLGGPGGCIGPMRDLEAADDVLEHGLLATRERGGEREIHRHALCRVAHPHRGAHHRFEGRVPLAIDAQLHLVELQADGHVAFAAGAAARQRQHVQHRVQLHARGRRAGAAAGGVHAHRRVGAQRVALGGADLPAQCRGRGVGGRVGCAGRHRLPDHGSGGDRQGGGGRAGKPGAHGGPHCVKYSGSPPCRITTPRRCWSS